MMKVEASFVCQSYLEGSCLIRNFFLGFFNREE